MLLATATARPADAATVRWLLPEDFTRPLHAGLWQCLTTLARRHEPVDPVTVLWEAQQRGLLDHGHQPGEVLRLLAEPAGSVGHWGERVLQRPLLTTVEHTGRRSDHARSPPHALAPRSLRPSASPAPSGSKRGLMQGFDIVA
ncbi:DnaB-like helicase N-terminal domain-containing protein [Streptomyces sp. NPDC018947]|uniref:DnaB-like helicase N-terminal domain-containing protein n=1 Tax=Streptomyces sp. NPDC018947 TaxID=3365054 RepID=UPI00378A772B